MSYNLILSVCLFAALNAPIKSNEVVNIDKGANYLAQDLHKQSVELVKRYPDILEMEDLGKSFDGNKMYAIRLSKNISQISNNPEFNVLKKHYLVEAGTHARETFNPVLVMKEIELYCQDYYDENTIPNFNMDKILESSVMHFLPLTNPDGFNLVKNGEQSIQTSRGKQSINKVVYIDQHYYKAGLRGVDFNRNYPSRYFDFEKETWVDFWKKTQDDLFRNEPSWAYFHGNEPASEPEVKIVMSYVDRYDFRNFISYHSQGEVLYWHQYYFSKIYNERSKSLAQICGNVNGYELMNKGNGIGSGYLSDYTTHRTLKPIVVVETIDADAERPTPQSYYRDAYDKNKLLPLYAVKEGEGIGYYKYRLYIDGIYIRDYEEKRYAKAHQIENGGIIIEGEGTPKFKIDMP